jgi:NAD-dependent SIR2 family protein deacetylase
MEALSRFVRAHPRLLVLTGAGISTGSGIPDYRDEAGRWKRKPPVLAQDFVRSTAVRRRYWARSMIGWPLLAAAAPNAAHHALARLEEPHIHCLVTQNVDGLHQRAGSTHVVELHGAIGRVRCLDCGAEVPRDRVQVMLIAANPGYAARLAAAAPDGDADVDNVDLDDFIVPECQRCGGVLKPAVVFFGDAVPRERVTSIMQALDEADALLVIGSSLMTYSSYRFCERAQRTGKPIAAVNLGRTRADSLYRLKVERPCAEALPALVAALL